MKVYGIKSCDRCRKALNRLDQYGRDYLCHDLREDGIDAADVQRWLDGVGVYRLVNRRSTPWRIKPPPHTAEGWICRFADRPAEADTLTQVLDYVAGMTDLYALNLHNRLLRPAGLV